VSPEFLWYIPNTVQAGHRGDDEANQWTSLGLSAELAQSAEKHGWSGALLGTGWVAPT
jgi:alkanesulfonate monooxygenase